MNPDTKQWGRSLSDLVFGSMIQRDISTYVLSLLNASAKRSVNFKMNFRYLEFSKNAIKNCKNFCSKIKQIKKFYYVK